MKRIAALVLVLAAGGFFWWRRHLVHTRGGKPATIDISWQGHRRGTMSLPAQLRWCPVTRTGVLEGLSGDSGIMVALRVPNVITTGPYVITSPDAIATLTPPYATAAFRWVQISSDSSLEQFRSQSGSVQLRVTGALISGTFDTHMRAPVGMPATDTLVVHAAFRDVPVVTIAAGCS